MPKWIPVFRRIREGMTMKRGWPLVAFAIAQFVMVLDQSVMNVSISTSQVHLPTGRMCTLQYDHEASCDFVAPD